MGFRLNLSSRPFYNERAVHLALIALAVLLAVVSVLNGREIVRLSARHTTLAAAISADEARASELRQRAAALQAQLRQEDLESVLGAAREANGLIDRRTFSWTELFNHLESTLPANVMLTAVQPKVDTTGIRVSIGVLSRSVDDVETFIQRLEGTGAFTELLSQSESPEESGLVRVQVVGRYYPTTRPAGAEPAPEGTTAAAAVEESAS